MEKSERRKKIISRGTDRMALITGRIQSLDPDPILKCTSFSTPRRDPPAALHARSSSESMAAHQESPLIPDEIHSGGVGASSHDTYGDQIYKVNNSGIRISNFHRLEKHEADRLKPDYPTSPEKPFLGYFLGSITPNEINFSIVSSEDTRVICSVVLAIMVVLCCLIFPPNALKAKTLIAYRPLYVVILTDVFIVAAKLAPYAQMERECKEEQIIADDGDNLGGALKLMELGLVLHQAIRALFIDCSFYLVVVVCGLSMV